MRPAPFALTELVVAGLITGRSSHARSIVLVPVLGKLIDRPSPSKGPAHG